jgi:hypothetical protein
MTDLRKAAEQTLELLEFLEIGNPTIKPCTENLRQALTGDVTGDVTGDAVDPEWDAVDRFHENKLKEKNT